MPDDLTPGERQRLLNWCRERYPKWATPERLTWVINDSLSYWGARQNPRGYHDWARVCMNRIANLEASGWDPFQARDRRSEGILERQPLFSRSWEEVKAEQERGADVIELSEFKGEER